LRGQEFREFGLKVLDVGRWPATSAGKVCEDSGKLGLDFLGLGCKMAGKILAAFKA